jgi:hypothetical protein
MATLESYHLEGGCFSFPSLRGALLMFLVLQYVYGDAAILPFRRMFWWVIVVLMRRLPRRKGHFSNRKILACASQ